MKNIKKRVLWVVVHTILWGFAGMSVSASPGSKPNSTKRTDLSVSTQQKEIKGQVIDQTGEPLIGASVVIKGTSRGTVTDIDGRFTLQVEANAILVISYLRYTTSEVRVDSKTDYLIEMKEDLLLMEEVVVVGYGTMKKQNLTGAVSSVKFDESTASRPTMTLSSALTGLSAGINIAQTSGTPGAEEVSILVRGQGTMNDASPLVIIDGVPGALNDVNPNDVESVSILKDAASSAIYGSRAANGVILVTTKRGGEGKVSLTYNGYVGWQNVAKKIDFINDMATHAEMVNQAAGLEKYPVSTIDEWRRESAAGNPLYPNTDWYDEMLNTALVTEHNLSIRGGTAKSNLAMSLGYLENQGIIDNSTYRKYSFRLNADAQATDWLKMGGNVFGSWSDQDPINVDSFFEHIRGTLPGVIPQHEDGRYGGTMFNGFPRVANPRAYVDNVRGNYERQKLGLKFFTTIKLLKSLEWESSFGFNYDSRHNWEYYHPYSLWDFQKSFEYQPSSNVDGLFNGTRRDYSTIVNTLLRFNHSINQTHNITALVGFDQQYNRMNKFDATMDDILGDDAVYILDAGVEKKKITGSGTDDALQSYFGRINYDYKSKYLLEANARYDGSSRFSKDNRWGFFPSFSAGWRVTEESFAESLKSVFDDIKLRASWGKLGNNRIGDYTYQIIYQSYLYPFGGALKQGAAPKEIANENVKWETTTLTNIGVDLALLKNKLSLSVEYYDKLTSDILVRIPIPLVLGNLPAPWQNVAEMSNKGVELQLSYRGKFGKDFSYQVNGNLSTVSNEVIKFHGDKSIDGVTITQEENMFKSYYVLEFDHIIQDQSEIDQLIADGYTFAKEIGGVPKPGDFLYKDANGDKVFDLDDRVVKDQSALPKLTYGISLNLAYKDIDLSVVGQGVGDVMGYWGNDGFNTFNINEGFLQRANILEHWTPENRSTKYPRLQLSSSTLNTVNSDYWLYNTSYFRIKSIQLGYSLPKSLTAKLSIDRIRCYTNLENYFTFTKFEGYNPENPSMAYPLMKQWVVGLNVTF